MGGNIGVESALGHGATFWFTLPLEYIENDAPIIQANFSDKRALIVDDNTTNRMILLHYLGNWGFTLFEAENGPAALAELEAAALRNEPYDLLLSDMQMPDMDGFALANAIKESPAIKNIPRILLSSGSIGSEFERQASGYCHSLLKPVRQSQLFDSISAALQIKGEHAHPMTKVNEILLNYSDKKVLVVEDNKVNQKVILSQLAKFKLNADLANNGQEALDLLEHHRYDLVFMDCQMPTMDGYEATRLIREQETGKQRTPITALTAHASAGEREKCLNIGMDDYLSKPVNRSDLAVVLARWLGLPTSYGVVQKSLAETSELDSALQENSISINKDKQTIDYPVICWDENTALKKLDNDVELLNEMIDLFIDEAPVQLTELSSALTRGDFPMLADAAHAIKGMSAHFCAEKIINLAINLEQAARNNAKADFQSMTSELAENTMALIENLQQRKMQNQ